MKCGNCIEGWELYQQGRLIQCTHCGGSGVREPDFYHVVLTNGKGNKSMPIREVMSDDLRPARFTRESADFEIRKWRLPPHINGFAKPNCIVRVYLK